MLLYDIFTGFPAANRSMAGFAGLFLALQALGSRGGNLRMLATSITSIPNRMTGSRIAQPEQATSLLSGTSIGFAASSLMALLPFNFRASYIGIAALIVGIVLKLTAANRQPAMAGGDGMQPGMTGMAPNTAGANPAFTQPGAGGQQGTVQCPQCGKQLASSAKFCPGCGNKMM
ncbi:MAG: zinc ribbon domain-containing protein, partial [Treponema sp.]|nr:zinc ribbon domain-containing protein [Treponema sp.]